MSRNDTVSDTTPADEVLAVQNGSVREIALNRPARRNALTASLVVSLHEQVQTAADSADVGAILIYGSGGSLCSGLDLKDPGMGEIGGLWQRFHRSVARMDTPIVIALEGAAVNAGAALTFAGDLVVAGRSAFLEVMEARIGMVPPVNLAWLLYRHSVSLAARLTLSCDRLTGVDLAELGIAHAIVDDDVVLAEARTLATRIAEYPNGSGPNVKAMLSKGAATYGATFDEVLDGVLASQ